MVNKRIGPLSRLPFYPVLVRALPPLVLFLTIPWLLTEGSSTVYFGFPFWALYMFLMCVCFAVLVCAIIGGYWEEFSSGEDGEDEL